MRTQTEVKAELARIDDLLKRARGAQINIMAARREALNWVLGIPSPFDTCPLCERRPVVPHSHAGDGRR